MLGLQALYLTWKCREGCYGERACSVRNWEASVGVETPVKCAEAGVGTAVLLWARQQAAGESRAAAGRAMCREQLEEISISENWFKYNAGISITPGQAPLDRLAENLMNS